MENKSPFLAMQRVEGQLKGILRTLDTDLLSTEEKKLVDGLKRLSIDARLDIRDYELSETREEQLKCAAAATKKLKKLEAAILATGSLFGAADVAQLTAQMQQIEGRLL
jgi:hypothetical protein